MQNPWTLLVRREALEELREAGVRGLQGCRTQVRFRQKNPPELLELEIILQGQLHTDCLPPERKPPCAMCGRHGFQRPDEPILDKASLPTHTDLFRVAHFATMIVGTEHFVQAVQRLAPDDILFVELPAR